MKISNIYLKIFILSLMVNHLKAENIKGRTNALPGLQVTHQTNSTYSKNIWLKVGTFGLKSDQTELNVQLGFEFMLGDMVALGFRLTRYHEHGQDEGNDFTDNYFGAGVFTRLYFTNEPRQLEGFYFEGGIDGMVYQWEEYDGADYEGSGVASAGTVGVGYKFAWSGFSLEPSLRTGIVLSVDEFETLLTGVVLFEIGFGYRF